MEFFWGHHRSQRSRLGGSDGLPVLVCQHAPTVRRNSPIMVHNTLGKFRWLAVLAGGVA